MVKKILKAALPHGLVKRLQAVGSCAPASLPARNIYAQESYSQEGEDMILQRIFDCRGTGFYVDVGAHHPQRFSNTYLFYLRGWSGINIDAMPGSMDLFRELRPRDTNVEVAVSDTEADLTYYEFNESALNGFSEQISEQRHNVNNFRIISQRTIQTRTLKAILDRYMPASHKIDFLSVDVEGLDLQVLRSNDWDKYRAEVVLVEDLEERPLERAADSEMVRFMQRQGYELYYKTVLTLFFRDTSR